MHIQITARLEYVQRQLVVKQIGDQYYMLHTVYTVAGWTNAHRQQSTVSLHSAAHVSVTVYSFIMELEMFD